MYIVTVDFGCWENGIAGTAPIQVVFWRQYRGLLVRRRLGGHGQNFLDERELIREFLWMKPLRTQWQGDMDLIGD